MKQQKIKFRTSMTGFLIGIILVSLLATTFATYFSGMSYDLNSTSIGFDNYNKFEDINSRVKQIKEGVEINKDSDILDIIGSYFRSGYESLMLTFGSWSIFTDITDAAARDNIVFAFLKEYLVAMVMVLIVLGVVVTILLKWYL